MVYRLLWITSGLHRYGSESSQKRRIVAWEQLHNASRALKQPAWVDPKAIMSDDPGVRVQRGRVRAGQVAGAERFPLGTCLVLSAFFIDASKKNLTRDRQLRELSREYALRAVGILDEIENDHLATVMLETPSQHDNRSPLHIALEHDIIDFLACTR